MTENTCSIWAAAFYMKCRPPILQRDQSSSHSLWRVAPIRDLVLPIWADVSEYGGRGGWLSAFPRRFRAQQRLAPFRSMGGVPEVPCEYRIITLGRFFVQNGCRSAVVLARGGGLLSGLRVSFSCATTQRFHLPNAGVPRGVVSYSAEWL